MFQPILFPIPPMIRFTGGKCICDLPQISGPDEPETFCSGNCLVCLQKRWCNLKQGVLPD